LAMVMGACSDMDFFNRCGNYNTYFHLDSEVRAMYSEQCKSCIVEGCPDSCSVKINYKRDLVRVVRCKDCKHRQEDTIFYKLYCDGREVVADGFCWKGERRSDE